jgi:hypothetical protein
MVSPFTLLLMAWAVALNLYTSMVCSYIGGGICGEAPPRGGGCTGYDMLYGNIHKIGTAPPACCVSSPLRPTFEMSLMQLVEELLPEVEDAPILGGHNRQPRAASAAPAAAPNPSSAAPAVTLHHPGAALMRVSSSGSQAFTNSAAFRIDPTQVRPPPPCH